MHADPTAENMPAAQLEQAVNARVDVVPASQAVQLKEPRVDEKYPAKQLKHAEESLAAR